MTSNEIKLQGYAYKCEVRKTQKGEPVTQFGLKFWNGAKDGKNQYAFVQVKHYGNQPMQDKTEVEVYGYLRLDEWQDKTSGEKRSRFVIVAKSIDLKSREIKQDSNELNDDIPF